MLEYKSNILIKIKNPKNKDLILQLFPDSFSEENLTIELELRTMGSPEQVFPDLAKKIWWANKEYAEIEFFVSESRLSYSSPTTLEKPQYDFLINTVA